MNSKLKVTCCLIAFAFILCACNSSKNIVPGILQGTISVGPLTPVERVGVPSPTPPPEVFTTRGIEIYPEGSTKLMASLHFTAQGTYRIELPAGRYTVQLPKSGIERAQGLPAEVEIKSGETVTLDISIDTGIR